MKHIWALWQTIKMICRYGVTEAHRRSTDELAATQREYLRRRGFGR